MTGACSTSLSFVDGYIVTVVMIWPMETAALFELSQIFSVQPCCLELCQCLVKKVILGYSSWKFAGGAPLANVKYLNKGGSFSDFLKIRNLPSGECG